MLLLYSRFEYEYAGGHIQGAINLPREDRVVSHFFDQNNQCLFPPDTIIVFHCEFSSQRGPAA